MTGPQFAPTDSDASSRAQRRFTVQEANQTLPLVRRIVEDIVLTHGQAVAMQSRLSQLPMKEQSAAQQALEKHLGRLEDFVDELTEIGCDLKDYSVGLIDFIGRHEGRDVCLCWKLGEPSVEYWHELTTGFMGRQPVAMLERA